MENVAIGKDLGVDIGYRKEGKVASKLNAWNRIQRDASYGKVKKGDRSWFITERERLAIIAAGKVIKTAQHIAFRRHRKNKNDNCKSPLCSAIRELENVK